jgi:hypothetical protein
MRGPNLNSGAESILSLQLSILNIEDLLARASRASPHLGGRAPPARDAVCEDAAV